MGGVCVAPHSAGKWPGSLPLPPLHCPLASHLVVLGLVRRRRLLGSERVAGAELEDEAVGGGAAVGLIANVPAHGGRGKKKEVSSSGPRVRGGREGPRTTQGERVNEGRRKSEGGPQRSRHSVSKKQCPLEGDSSARKQREGAIGRCARQARRVACNGRRNHRHRDLESILPFPPQAIKEIKSRYAQAKLVREVNVRLVEVRGRGLRRAQDRVVGHELDAHEHLLAARAAPRAAELLGASNWEENEGDGGQLSGAVAGRRTRAPSGEKWSPARRGRTIMPLRVAPVRERTPRQAAIRGRRKTNFSFAQGSSQFFPPDGRTGRPPSPRSLRAG